MPSKVGGITADAATFKAMEAGSAQRRRGRSRPEVGHLAPLALSAGVGLLLCAVANALSRATLTPAMPFYWGGILLLAVPIFYRLTSEDASARERLTLVCMLGLSLYLVKVFRDAPLFTFSDELVHPFNANQIADHHHLFRGNPILTATPYYPGLEGAASALMKLTGVSAYGAGLILIGAARGAAPGAGVRARAPPPCAAVFIRAAPPRLVLVASLFLLFERVSGSA